MLEKDDVMKPFDYIKEIERFGHEAYIVGGYVRDYLLGSESYDVDITTSATPNEISKIFKISNSNEYGCIKIHDSNYNIEITTFRRESNYDKRRPQDVEYIKDLYSDLMRRDFTINAICMDGNRCIVDPLNGVMDLDKKTIRVIGEVDSKFNEDPLRMLRALRISICHNLEIESEALSFILNNKNLFNFISFFRKKECLTKILLSDNVLKGIDLLNRYNLMDVLGIRLRGNFIPSKNYYVIWAQIDFDGNFPFTKNELKKINNIKSIVKYGAIDKNILFKYGIEDSLDASELLGIDKHIIDILYESMPIKNINDLCINGNEISDIIRCIDKIKIKVIKEDLINLILSGNLTNSKKDLYDYIVEKWK